MKIYSKQPTLCKIRNCPAIEKPICLKIKNENETKNILYVRMVNKCEMEYLKCHPGTHGTVVPLKYCDHTPKPEMTEATIRTKRSLRTIQKDEDDKNIYLDHKEKKYHNQEALYKVLNSVLKEKKQKSAKKYTKTKKQQRNLRKDMHTTTEATTTTMISKRTTKPLKPIPGVVRVRDNNHNAREKKTNVFRRQYKVKFDQDDNNYGEHNDNTNENYLIGNADNGYEDNDYAADYDKTNLIAQKDRGQVPKLLNENEEQYPSVENVDNDDNNPADENINLENDSNPSNEINNEMYQDLKNDDANDPDFNNDHYNDDDLADNENYSLNVDSNEVQGKELTPDYNKLVFPHHYDDDTEENAQQEEFNSDCPKTCPARGMMVCARCKHGVYRTFLSICHMRMFTCTKGQKQEELQLVSREPCVVSAPHLGSPGEHPAGHVREPSDHDAILQFIHFNEQNQMKVMDEDDERAMALANKCGDKCYGDEEELGDVYYNPLFSLFYNPDKDNIYHIYTRRNPVISQSISMGDRKGLEASNFNPKRNTVILIHGWTNNISCDFYKTVIKAYLKADDVNIIAVDWSKGSSSSYTLSCSNVPKSGESVAKFINWVNRNTGSKPSQYHIVGFSLGGQQAGIVARKVDGKVSYISALDPAMPLWTNDNQRLRKTDAAYVEVIHSNAGTLGMLEALGHVDFYMNGGQKQPGCKSTNIMETSCHHARSYQYFAESLTTKSFVGRKCDSVKSATKNACLVNPDLIMGGLKPKNGAQGIYHIKTNHKAPFAIL